MRQVHLITLSAMLLIGGCSGSGDSNGMPPAPFDPSKFVGTYNGTWKNLKYGTSGSVNIVITDDTNAKTMSMSITLGGNVFGAMAPSNFSVTGPYTTQGFSVSQQTQAFGNVQASIIGNGAASGKATGIQSTVVSSMTYNSSISGTSVNGTYLLNLTAGGTANGTITATKS